MEPPMITIYGSPSSSAGRCFWCLEELGLNYESQTISFKENEHKSSEFLKINPNGKIPALIDNDFVMSESMAINFYLAEKYSPDLLGTTLQERAKIRQWSFWAIADLQPPLINIFIQLIFVPEERRDQKVIDNAEKKLPSLLSSLNSQLEKKSYLIGDVFTLADLNVQSVISICKSINYDISTYKNIIRWQNIIGERPAYQKYLSLCQ